MRSNEPKFLVLPAVKYRVAILATKCLMRKLRKKQIRGFLNTLEIIKVTLNELNTTGLQIELFWARHL